MYRAILTLTLSLLLALSSAIEFEDCGTEGILYSVDIDNCPDAPCKVDHGDTVRGVVRFEAAFKSDYVDCEIFGVIGGQVSEGDSLFFPVRDAFCVCLGRSLSRLLHAVGRRLHGLARRRLSRGGGRGHRL